MKVAIVVEHIESWRGGAETSTVQFTHALQQAGHDVHIISREPRTPVRDLTVHPVDPYSSIRQHRTLTFARHAALYTAARSFDIIHAVTPCMTADIYQPRGGFVVESVRRNLAIRQTPLARALKHLTSLFNKKTQGMIRLERRLMTRRPSPPWIAAVSGYVVRQAREHFNLPEDRARVIFNGVDLDHTPQDQRRADVRNIRSQYGIAPDDLLILFVAHNFKLKGLTYLLHAVKDAADRGLPVRCLVAGHGRIVSYRRLAAGLGIPDRVRFSGPTAQIRRFFHAADLLAHPTFYDPCSRVVLEAIAAGLPTVTTRFNGASEIITDGVNGCLIDDPTDVPALTEALCSLADPHYRARIARNAMVLCDRFDMANHARQMIQFYEDVLRRK